MLVTNDCNSNVDTCCLVQKLVTPCHTNRAVDVYAYDKEYGLIKYLPVMLRSTAYDDVRRGLSYLTILNRFFIIGIALNTYQLTSTISKTMGSIYMG